MLEGLRISSVEVIGLSDAWATSYSTLPVEYSQSECSQLKLSHDRRRIQSTGRNRQNHQGSTQSRRRRTRTRTTTAVGYGVASAASTARLAVRRWCSCNSSATSGDTSGQDYSFVITQYRTEEGYNSNYPHTRSQAFHQDASKEHRPNRIGLHSSLKPTALCAIYRGTDRGGSMYEPLQSGIKMCAELKSSVLKVTFFPFSQCYESAE